MARIRTIKPDFFRDEELQDLEAANPGAYVMLVYAGLWGHCDKAGTFEWRPRVLKLDILPFIDYDIERTLGILVAAKMIHRFSTGSKEYGHVPGFAKHQRISGKESQEPEKYPKFQNEAQENNEGTKREAQGKQPRSQEGKGREGNKSSHREAHSSEVSRGAPASPEPRAPEPSPPPEPPPAQAPPEPEPPGIGDNPTGSLEGDRIESTPPAALLARVCRANGVTATPFHPTVMEWAMLGIDEKRLKAAIAVARSRKGPDAKIPVGYLDPILREADRPSPQAWRGDDGKAEALCRELGIRGAKTGEDRFTWHQRIDEALQDRARRGIQ